MIQLLKRCRIVFLPIALSLSCCTYQLQQQLDDQKQAISILEQKIRETDRTLAGYQNDLDKIRIEFQAINGKIEENSHFSKNEIASLQNRMDQLLAESRKKQEKIEQLQQQFSSATTGPRKKQGTPAASVSSEQQLYNLAYNLFKKGEFKNARQLFEKFLRDYPNSKLTDNAMYWIGNCYFKEKNFEKAISVFDDVIKNFPGGNKVPDAYYLQALSFCGIEDTLSAQLILETLIQNFPSSKAASLAKKKHNELKALTTP